ncbi:MAG: lipopolysaccharide biosynthesis protein [bacterium]|nr:lipopolysaccharide biosynthesis protein [bacterium]
MAALSLRRNFAWTLVGNIVYALCLWAQLALLTKLGGPEVVGRFSLGSAIASPVLMFAQLSLRPVLASDARGEYTFQDYLGLRVALLPPALLVVGLVAWFGYSPAQTLVICLFGLGRAVESMSDIYFGFQQKQERMDLAAVSLMAKGVAALALFGVVFRTTGSLDLSLASMVAGWLLVLVVFDLPRTARLVRACPGQSMRPRFDRAVMRRLALLSLPMGTVFLAIQLRATIPRAILERSHGEADLGIFSALSYLVIAGNTMTQALAQSSLAGLGRDVAARDTANLRRRLRQLTLLGVGLGIAGVVVSVVAGGPLLSLMYTPEYATQVPLLVLVMAGGAVLYVASLLGAPATAMRAFTSQLWVHLTSVAAMFAAGAVLVPRLGMMGAAWTMLIGSAWVLVGTGEIVRRGLRRLEGAP